MTRSEMIKLLGHAASVLKSMKKATSAQAAGGTAVDPQLESDILQVILQILQEILAAQGQSSAADLPADDAQLLAAVGSVLDSIKQDLPGVSAQVEPNVQIGGVQIDILQLILQIITAILNQQKPAPTPAPAAVEELAQSEVIRPLVTSDSITYTIDTLGRLTKLTYASGDSVIFNYDSVGNRTSVVTAL